MNISHSTSSNKWTIFAIILQFSHKRHPHSVCSRGVTKRFRLRQTVVWTNTIVDNHVPPMKLHYPQAESDPFSSTDLGIFSLLFLIPAKPSMSSCIHNCITCIHSILGQKMVYFIFKSLGPVKSKISSSNLRTKKLK